MSEARTPALDALLADADWIRGLAVGLLGEARADDALQDAWLAAVRSGPGTRENPRGWLATVLRNAALRIRRGEARRLRREELVAAREASGASTLEVVERFSTQQAVAAAVLELDAPYRAALLLRFYEDLTLEEVGAREGVSRATAHERVKHGLELLRRRLELRLGVRGERFALALAPLVVHGRRASVASTTTAAAAGNTGALALAGKLLACASATVLVGWLLLRDPLAPAEQRMAAVPVFEPAADARGLEERGAGITPPAEVPALRTPLHASIPLAAEGPGALASLRVVVREQGFSSSDPLTVSLHPRVGLPAAGGARSQPLTPAGVAVFDGLAPGTWYVETERGGQVEATLTPGVEARVELELPAGPALRGVVVDPLGFPVPDALVWLSPRDGEVLVLTTRVPAFVPAGSGIRTDAEGAFRFASIGHARTVGACAVGWAPTRDVRLAHRDGAELELRLQLPGPGASLAGSVRGPAGQPVVGAAVYLDAAGDGPGSAHLVRTRTRAGGAFRFDSVAPGQQELRVCASGLANLRMQVELVGGEESVTEIELARGMRVEGRVTQADGSGVADAIVFASRRAWTMLPDERFGVVGRSGPDGTYRLNGVAARAAWLVVVAAGAGRSEELIRGADGEVLRHDVVLPGRLRLAGRVTGASGAGVHPLGVMATPERDFAPRTASTDREGRFVIELDEAGEHQLSFEEHGVLLPRRSVAMAGVEDLLVRLDDSERPNATITGVALDDADAPLDEIRLRLRDAAGLEREVMTSLVGNGHFRAEHLLPGTYALTLASTGRPDVVLAEPITLTAQGTHELGVFVVPPGQRLEIDFQRTDGARLRDVQVAVRDPEDQLVKRSSLRDAPGELPLVLVLAPGPHRLRAWAAELVPLEVIIRADAPDAQARQLVHLEPGIPSTLELHLPAEAPKRLPVLLELRDESGATVFAEVLRGRQQLQLGLRPGLHAFEARAEGGLRSEGTFVVPQAQPPFPRPGPSPGPVPVVLRRLSSGK